MAAQRRTQKKKPTAANKIKKIDKDLFSSQFSQQQNSQTQHYIKTPVRKTIAFNALVGKNQSIFSPVKAEESVSKVYSSPEENSEHDDLSESAESTDDSDFNGSDDNEFDGLKEIGSKDLSEGIGNRLKNYSVPLNTRNWQPLPPHVYLELYNLLHLLVPPTTTSNDEKIKKVLESEIIKPLAQKFSTISLPPLNRSIKTILEQQRTSGEFNLSYLNQEQLRLSQGYDINSKQLDMLSLQLFKEEEMLELEKKYVRDLKSKVQTWKKNKSTRIDRLKALLGSEFGNIKQLLDIRSSGLNGVDDIDLLLNSDSTDEDDSVDLGLNDKSIKKLNKLNKKLIQANKTNKDAIEMQLALQHLLNTFKK